MAIIKCKMCGGDLILTEGQTVAECEYCGSRQTVPRVDDERKVSLFARAERLRRNCEFDKAAGIYESIVSDFPEEAEAYWGLVLCRYGIEYVDDPGTGKKIPTCHRSSFESILEDPDLDQALENADLTARRIYREEAKQIEELRKGIIAVSANEEPYDIFICYKETDDNGDRTLDSVLAQDIYDALTDKGYRVFFSRISLEDKLGIEYEPYIFAALNSARIMLAVGTDYEYYNAVWVKNEWSRFLKLMAKDKQKHLIPCFKGLDAYDMPKEFAKLQAQDLGKVGAIQDLLRGIEKLLPKETAAPAEQKPEQPSVVYAPNSVEPLLERIGLFLEDRDFESAETYCERVLDTDPKNALAYLYKFLISQRHPNLESLVRARLEGLGQEKGETHTLKLDQSTVESVVWKYEIPGYLPAKDIRSLFRHRDFSYTTYGAYWRMQKDREKQFWNEQKELNRAVQFASGTLAEEIASAKTKVSQHLSQKTAQAEQQDAAASVSAKEQLKKAIQDANDFARELNEKAEAKRKARYDALVSEVETADPGRLSYLEREFQKLSDYRDSRRYHLRCMERTEETTEAKRRAHYDALVSEVETADPERLSYLEREFQKLSDYRDSKKHLLRCKERFAEADRESKYARYRQIAYSRNSLQEICIAAIQLSRLGNYKDAPAILTVAEKKRDCLQKVEQLQFEIKTLASKRKLLEGASRKSAYLLQQLKQDYRHIQGRWIYFWIFIITMLLAFIHLINTGSSAVILPWILFICIPYIIFAAACLDFLDKRFDEYSDFPALLHNRVKYFKQRIAPEEKKYKEETKTIEELTKRIEAKEKEHKDAIAQADALFAQIDAQAK